MSEVATTPFDPPLSENPVLFGYAHASGEIENISLQTGEYAELMAEHADEVSGVRIISRDDWEIFGYKVADRDGINVVTKVFDYTEAKLTKRRAAEVVVKDAKEETVDDMKATIEKQGQQIDKLMALVQKSNEYQSDQVEAKAKERELEEMQLLAQQAEVEKAAKAKPKPRAKARA